MSRLCQSCRIAPVEFIEPRDDPDEPYELCLDCHHRLVTLSLRPREWYNLSSIHSFYKFCLHDDFYDETGASYQPEEPVLDADQFPCPSLRDVSHSPDELLHYAFTRWQIRDEFIQAMKAFPADVWLETMESCLKQTRNTAIIDTVFFLCGKALGQDAAAFIRHSWKKYRGVALADRSLSVWHGLCYAIAKCLPFEEGFAFIIQALSETSDEDRCAFMYVLGWFETPYTLDWIEKNIHEFDDTWGHLAALSKFDWQHVKKWLSLGRPLSLVALDALKCCVTHNSLMLQEQKPRLVAPPSKEELTATLEKYRKSDSVPRVERRVSFLLANLETLTGDLL